MNSSWKPLVALVPPCIMPRGRGESDEPGRGMVRSAGMQAPARFLLTRVPMIPFSILDLAPIAEGSTASDAFRNSVELAQEAERLGFHRVWLAEHHGMAGIASAATAV